MKNVLLSLAVLALCCCATVTPYSGPTSADTTSVTLEASGLMKHAAMPDDTLVVHIFDGNQSAQLGTVKLTTDRSRETLKFDVGKPISFRFMSMQPHFGGYTTCNLDVPFVADEHVSYSITYLTSKNACTTRISKLTPEGHSILLSELAGTVNGVQYKAEVIY